MYGPPRFNARRGVAALSVCVLGAVVVAAATVSFAQPSRELREPAVVGAMSDARQAQSPGVSSGGGSARDAGAPLPEDVPVGIAFADPQFAAAPAEVADAPSAAPATPVTSAAPDRPPAPVPPPRPTSGTGEAPRAAPSSRASDAPGDADGGSVEPGGRGQAVAGAAITPTTTTTTTLPPASSEAVPAPAAPATAPVVIGSLYQVNTNGRIVGGPAAGQKVESVLADAGPGDRFAFEAGTHEPLRIQGVHGTDAAPIVVAALDPGSPPTFTSQSYSNAAGVHVLDSSHVVVENVRVRRSLWGARVEASSHVVLDRLDVRDTGQEAVRVLDASSWVTIQHSTIADTGNRPGSSSSGEPYSIFGEGIYLGTGATSADPVHHVTILGNDISQTSTEAIDIKVPVTDVVVRGNVIHDIETGTSGAVTVHAKKDYAAADPNIRIVGNEIRNISTRSQYRDGVGVLVGSSADVIANTFVDIEHFGVRVEDVGAPGGKITARIEQNQFVRSGIRAIHQSGDRATLLLDSNSGV